MKFRERISLLLETLIIFAWFGDMKALTLNCDIKATGWYYLGNLQTNIVENVNITISNQIITTINGETSDQFGTRSEKALLFDNQNVYYMPKKVEDFFPYLEVLAIARCGLKSIRQSNLKPFGKLKVLHLRENDIEILPKDLFEFNLELRFVNFDQNKIKYINLHVLDHLTNLDKAILLKNDCIDKYAKTSVEVQEMRDMLKTQCQPTSSSEMEWLVKYEIETSRNIELSSLNFELSRELDTEKVINMKLITKLKSCDSSLNAAVRNLFMCHNQEVPEKQEIDLVCNFDGKNCDVIDLKVEFSNSVIGSVKDQSGKDIATEQVQSLKVDSQQILFLPKNIAEVFPNMIHLLITDSGLAEINPVTFAGMKNLQTLILNNNKIIEVPSNAFKNCLNLLKLNLSFNLIRAINNGAFQGLRQLQELKLNDNFLTKIIIRSFEGLASLEALFLHNNSLKFVISTLFSQLAQLSTADFTNNDCIDAKFPESTREEILTKIIDRCLVSIKIKCNFEDDEIALQNIQLLPGSYACKTRDLTIRNVKILGVIGEHLENSDINNVTVFTVIDQATQFIPSDLALHFPNLNKIVVENSKLIALLKHNFAGFAKLRTISLRHNELSSIEAGAFDDVMWLEYLNIAHNNIASLQSKIFAKLVRLKVLNLSHNQLTSLSADILPRTHVIEQFKADKNKLSKIELIFISSFSKATQIDLKANDCIDAKVDTTDNAGTSFETLFFKVF